MKKTKIYSSAVLTLLFALFSLQIQAALIFDQDVTPDAIFGSGNANGSFTIDQNFGIELGLRGKLRYNNLGLPENTFNSNGDGSYNFNAGPAVGVPAAGEWAFEWSINTNYDGSSGFNLNDLSYLLQFDVDPSAAQNLFSFDLINTLPPFGFYDHAIGTNASGNGLGVEATDAASYQTLISNNNVAQNSWQFRFFPVGFDPNLAGVYDISLAAFNANGDQLAKTEIQINVQEVPAPAGLVFLLLSMLYLLRMGRK